MNETPASEQVLCWRHTSSCSQVSFPSWLPLLVASKVLLLGRKREPRDPRAVTTGHLAGPGLGIVTSHRQCSFRWLPPGC